MKIFIDSANIEKIKAVTDIMPVDGVTTNPTIISRENISDLPCHLRKLRELTEGKTLFVQTTSDDAEGMIRDAECIIKALGGDLCIKLPATQEGLRAVSTLSGMGISVTATAVYTPCQALLFAKAGADYVAPYLSHIDNMVIDSASIVSEMASLLSKHGLPTKVLGASFRTAEQVNRVVLAGAGAVTLSPEMLLSLVTSRQTEDEIASFRSGWKSVYGDMGISELLEKNQ